MHRVLVVEDDHTLREALARALREAGYTVVTAPDGRTALASAEGVEAVVLDIGLPDADGRDVCLALRGAGVSGPVLFLTARGELHERLAGFGAGGDDYLTKPFHTAELLARLKAALRRAGQATSTSTTELTLDPARHSLTRGEHAAVLSPTEFRLLALLLGRRGEVVRRRELREAGWPVGGIVQDNTLDQYVARIRRRLREVGADVEVSTVRGVGYRLDEG